MTYKLHMNGVITGSLNSFCLACNCFLKSQQEATEHVEASEHKKNLNAVQYSGQFKDEHIRKFKRGYYCEFCNVLLPIASKVNLHVTEDTHKYNKAILLLKPMGGDVVAFNNILIKENAWHGLIDGVCSLCNAEFEDENDHKTDTSHLLNLILKSIQFRADNAIYRHLDDTAVQCLTCNKLLTPCRMTKHFDDSEHHELFAKHRIETNGVGQEHATNGPSVIENDNEIKKSNIDIESNKNKKLPAEEEKTKIESIEKPKSKTNNDRNNNKKPSAEEKSKILESIAKYQRKGININLETDTAFCKKCSKVITFDSKEIENHIDNHSSVKTVDADLQYPSNVDQNLNRVDINDKTTKKSDDVKSIDDKKSLTDERKNDFSKEEENDTDDSSSSPMQVDEAKEFAKASDFEKCSQVDEAKEFAKKNKINYNEDNNHSYCRICEVQLPASFRSMKEHVAGAPHKKMVASSKIQLPNPGKQSKQETRHFVDSAYDVNGIFYNASIVNEEYCIPQESFYLISENNSRLRCIICEVNLPPYSDIEDHVKTRQHSIKFLAVPFIITEKTEFIREVRPGLYHCGYCNLVVSGWTDMKQHLKCSDHQESRTDGEHRLRIHMPGLQQHKMRENLRAFTMMRLFNMF